VLGEGDPVQGRLAVRVVRGVAIDTVALESGEPVAVLAQALEEVELLGKDLLEHVELVKADEVRADQRDGLVALPLVVAALFLSVGGQ
jgi:hypothetical protein